MAKMRIYALANELNIESKEIIKFLAEKEITGKVASSSVEDEQVCITQGRGRDKSARKGNTAGSRTTDGFGKRKRCASKDAVPGNYRKNAATDGGCKGAGGKESSGTAEKESQYYSGI